MKALPEIQKFIESFAVYGVCIGQSYSNKFVHHFRTIMDRANRRNTDDVEFVMEDG